MPPDCYKIQIIHYLNPHLIWIEVRDPSVQKEEFVFEQIGVYGVLPLEQTLDILTENLTTKKCKDWLPAASVAMNDLLVQAEEVWFSPTHIDRRTSIFDDNIHKYGEIIVKTKKGKLQELSKHLVKSCFAYSNLCTFHEKLSCGKLRTKLDTINTQEVIKELEKYCLQKDRSKNHLKKSVEKQTSVFQMFHDFEMSLTESNLEKHNNENIKKTLKNKYKDFELCKGIDDEPIGRAFHRVKVKTPETNKEVQQSHLLSKKLSISKKITTSPTIKDANQTYNSIIKFLGADSKINDMDQSFESSTSENNTISEVDAIVEIRTKENMLSKKLKSITKIENASNSLGSESDVGKVVDIVKKSVTIKTDMLNSTERNRKDKFKKNQIETDEMDNVGGKLNRTSKCRTKYKDKSVHSNNVFDDQTEAGNQFEHNSCIKTARIKENNNSFKTIAYGPPGLDPSLLKLQALTVSDDEEEYEKQKINIKNVTTSEKRDCMYGDVDSEVGVEISNKKTLLGYFNKDNIDGNVNCMEKLGEVDNKGVKTCKVNDCGINGMKNEQEFVKNCETTCDSFNLIEKGNKIIAHNETFVQSDFELSCRDDSIGQFNRNNILKKSNVECGLNISNDNNCLNKKTTALIKRKLKSYHNAVKYNNLSSSDTSNKDSSSDVASNKKANKDDDDIEEVIEKLNLKYKDDDSNKIDQKPISNSVNITELKNNVNPFKNVDPNISVFVDKLVTPVLMVHSKHYRRIQPVFEMRDIYFNSHIQNILRNMSIEKPMMLQSISWSVILRGYSLFMISPMASGKTLGYLPAVCRLVSDFIQTTAEIGGPICIIVCATALSVTNVEKMAKMFLPTDNRVLACYAGVDTLHITTTLLNGCDLLIATPSALVRLLQATDFGVDLTRLATFVMDDCERLSEVYVDEIKYFTHKIKDMLKKRANKDLKVQYVLASRIWCDFMATLSIKATDTVICIGAFQECVLYSKTNVSVTLTKKEHKVDSVIEFLKDINTSKRTVIVCESNDEVTYLENLLKRANHVIFTCNNDMTIHDLYNLSVSWADYKEPLIGPILICCDSNLIHMNITDGHNLIHYSMPPLFSMFCKRFSVLNDNYPSIFKEDNENVKIKVLLEENNVEQLPKILHFIKRCTDNVPRVLDEISSSVLKEKDVIKAGKLYPLCDSLLTLGYCPDLYNCQERHTILKLYDAPKHWLPKEGTITCKVLYYHSATLYSARILSCTLNNETINYPQTYNKLSLKLGMYYSKESNKKLHGTPHVGDICATSIKLNLYIRCQVLKILNRYDRGNPNKVLVKLIDEERLEVTRDIYLYHLPEELKNIETRVVQIRLANIEPKDKDITFSELARDKLKKITDTDTELFVKGQVALTLGNCIFVNTLEACQDLTSLNEVVVKYNLKQELLENHAIPNPEHLKKLEKMCTEGGLILNEEKMVIEPKKPVKNLPKGTWAHLEKDSLSSVYFASAINPHKFFVRLAKFESCMSNLLREIKKYINANPTSCDSIKEGEIVLAKFPDNNTYERARIDCIKEESVKCFFVDQGDWREIVLNDLKPITEQFIKQLPFQAIECRLVGIKPLGERWTDFSTNWFTDYCYNDQGDLKYLFAKYFTKDTAECTNGHKYSVALIDTSSEDDVILNQLMMDFNLAQENLEELKYLDQLEINKPEPRMSDTQDVAVSLAHSNEKIKNCTDAKDVVQSYSNVLFKAPIRSVPLVNSDNESDDSDKWDVNIDDDCMNLFPALKNIKTFENNMPKVNKETTLKSVDHGKRAEIVELDSDDLTSPDNSLLSPVKSDLAIEETINTSKPVLDLRVEKDQKRRPKLVWRQNKTNVTIKIQLIGAENYKLRIDDRIIDFSSDVNDTEYGFELELYGVVQKENCSHVNKGQYILVKLKKVLSKNWLTLTRDGGIKKWIVYDVDNLDTSSEEESTVGDIKDIVRNIHNKVDTESEDDDFDDDAIRGYRKS